MSSPESLSPERQSEYGDLDASTTDRIAPRLWGQSLWRTMPTIAPAVGIGVHKNVGHYVQAFKTWNLNWKPTKLSASTLFAFSDGRLIPLASMPQVRTIPLLSDWTGRNVCFYGTDKDAEKDWVECAFGLSSDADVVCLVDSAIAFHGGESTLSDQLVTRLSLRSKLPVAAGTFTRQSSPTDSLNLRLLRALEAEAVEDGMSHPGEAILVEAADALRDAASPWFARLLSNDEDSRWAASILRLLARVGLPTSDSDRGDLIRYALDQEDIVLRDAAVEAVDLWGSPPLLRILSAHQESAPWLADYIARVIRDLSV